jgi:general transcription factor 3C polypeptide 5 (transcription factor C subunit 1)
MTSTEHLIPAPIFTLPHLPLVSVEYPGYISSDASQSTSSCPSLAVALNTLGGINKINQAIISKETVHALELNLDRSGNLFSHPVAAEKVSTGNVIMKVVRRRRKNRKEGEDEGIWTMTAVGVSETSFRFRGKTLFVMNPSKSLTHPSRLRFL